MQFVYAPAFFVLRAATECDRLPGTVQYVVYLAELMQHNKKESH
jgi:hypothetical protein